MTSHSKPFHVFLAYQEKSFTLQDAVNMGNQCKLAFILWPDNPEYKSNEPYIYKLVTIMG